MRGATGPAFLLARSGAADTEMKDPLVNTIVEGLREAKARDIRAVDMSGIDEAAFMYFVICEGTSSTHVAGIADTLTDYVRRAADVKDLGSIGLNNRLWVAVDYGYVLVHIFQPEARRFYRLEELWSDAPTETFES